MAEKLKLAFYWAASCGGCEIAVADIHEHLLDVDQVADIVFWPCLMDFKYEDVANYPDKYIDVCFFNGAIRNSEAEHIAKLLRCKSKILVAFGTCSAYGGIPGLANFKSREEILYRAYEETPSTDNPDKVYPETEYEVDEGKLTLPEFYDRVYTLAQIVPVDYIFPGCPPVAEQIWAGIEAIVAGKLPAPGPDSVIGAGTKTVCDECPRERTNEKITEFKRSWEIMPDPNRCLLEQGILCMGRVTRSGCNAAHPRAGNPCRGCYGPPPNVRDQGAKFASAIASMIDIQSEEDVERLFAKIPDPAGWFYSFSLPYSTLQKSRSSKEAQK